MHTATELLDLSRYRLIQSHSGARELLLCDFRYNKTKTPKFRIALFGEYLKALAPIQTSGTTIESSPNWLTCGEAGLSPAPVAINPRGVDFRNPQDTRIQFKPPGDSQAHAALWVPLSPGRMLQLPAGTIRHCMG